MSLHDLDRFRRVRELGLVELEGGLSRSPRPPALDPPKGDRPLILFGLLLAAASGAFTGLVLGWWLWA